MKVILRVWWRKKSPPCSFVLTPAHVKKKEPTSWPVKLFSSSVNPAAKLRRSIFCLLQGESPDCLITAGQHSAPSTALIWNTCQSIIGTNFPIWWMLKPTERIQMVSEFKASSLIFILALRSVSWTCRFLSAFLPKHQSICCLADRSCFSP